MQQEVAQRAKYLDTVQNPHQADVDPHVAIQYVTKLMGNNALQLLAVQLLNRPLSNSNDRITRREPRRKSIDPRLPCQQINRWRGRSRCYCHFFNNIKQSALIGFLGIAGK